MIKIDYNYFDSYYNRYESRKMYVFKATICSLIAPCENTSSKGFKYWVFQINIAGDATNLYYPNKSDCYKWFEYVLTASGLDKA